MSSIIKLTQNNHLIVLATPIGNLQEINTRAINAVNNNKYFLCEDTRTTRQLFNLLNIDISNKEFISYHKYNEKIRSSELLQLLQESNLVLVSDAGYPAISDPGYVIINECIKNNVFIEVINGSNAFVNALVVSGWSNLPVSFYGFVDWNKLETKQIANNHQILCFFESVHRINKTLKKMYKIFGNCEICIVRELTKLNETHYYDSLKSIKIPEEQLKGEFVILINNMNNQKKDKQIILDEFKEFNDKYQYSNLKQKIKLYLDLLNENEINANELYNLILQEKNEKN